MAPQLLLGCWEILRGKPGRGVGGMDAVRGPLPASLFFAGTVGPVGASGSVAPCPANWVDLGISAAASGPLCQTLSPDHRGGEGQGDRTGSQAPGRRVPHSLCKEPGSGAWRPLGLGCSLCSQRPCATAVGLSLHFTCTCSQTLVPGGWGGGGGGGRARTPHVPSGPASLAARNPRTRRHPEQNSGTGLGKSKQNTSVAVSVRSP